jgi:hypothetical protein
VIAAGLLVLDWARNRRRSRAVPAADVRREPAPEVLDEPVVREPVFQPEPLPEPEPVSAEPVSAEPVFPSAEDPDAEPAEEMTDATDLLLVTELSDEVWVVDERPRYHLPVCVWLATRPTLPLPVSEARQLGFTPCARCSPDAMLAARHRAGRARG